MRTVKSIRLSEITDYFDISGAKEIWMRLPGTDQKIEVTEKGLRCFTRNYLASNVNNPECEIHITDDYFDIYINENDLAL